MAERLALIAGAGALVPELIAAAIGRGYAVKVLTLGRRRDLAAYDPVPFSLTAPQAAVETIRAFGATSFAMAGGVSLSDIARERLSRFFTGSAAMPSVGDTNLSTLAQSLGEMAGARLVGVREIAPELLAPEGPIAGPSASVAQQDAAAFAMSLARKAGALDLGQAVVVAGRRAVASEDIAGTDALLRRVQTFARLGLVADGGSPLVLAKCAKPDQPLAIDLPAIGPVTVARAAAARISVIAVQAGATVLIQREKLAAAAMARKVSIIGLRVADV